jgi:hypothetical protein
LEKICKIENTGYFNQNNYNCVSNIVNKVFKKRENLGLKNFKCSLPIRDMDSEMRVRNYEKQ